MPADSAVRRAEAPTPIAGETVKTERNVKGFARVGRALLAAMDDTVYTFVERIRGDQSLNVAAGLKFSQIADHFPTLLADIAGALVMIEELKGQPSLLLADATEIQRLVSERHGVQRRALGWNEASVRREFMIVREEVERVIRAASSPEDPLPVEDGVSVIGRFLDQSEYVAVKAVNAGIKP
jgi:hypothetical protein